MRATRCAHRQVKRQLAAECRLGAAEQRFEIVVAEPAQHQHLGARQQRADQLEGRVLGRGSDEDHGAVLDDRQECVLLGAVEAVDLVDKEQGAAADLAALARRLEHLAQVGDAGKDSRQRLEFEIGAVRQQACDRGLAAAGRPPQDHRGELPARDHSSDRAIRAEQMNLPHDLAEALRPQAVGERPRRLVFEEGGHYVTGRRLIGLPLFLMLVVRVFDWKKARILLIFTSSIEAAESCSATDLAVICILDPAQNI